MKKALITGITGQDEMHNFAIRSQRLTFAIRTAPPLATTHQAFDLLEA